MATAKQKAASRKNIKKALAVRWGHKPYRTRKVRTPINRTTRVPLDKIKTLI